MLSSSNLQNEMYLMYAYVNLIQKYSKLVFPAKILAGTFPCPYNPHARHVYVSCELESPGEGCPPRGCCVGSLASSSDHGFIPFLSTWLLLSNHQRT